MTPSNSAALAGSTWCEQPQPLASWYTEGLSDGIGDRLLMFDNRGTPSLELLRFRPILAGAAGFEDAIRKRVDALDTFDHRAFSRVRAVERLDGGDLAIVSTFTSGKRVGEIFWNAQARTGVHPSFAAWTIRESIAAVADLHRQGDAVAHGAISPDRIILIRDGRVVIVEHVLGDALDRLHIPVRRASQVLGLVAVGGDEGVARFNQRTDVVQVAWIVLGLLLGRPLAPLDYPHRVETLLDDFVRASRERSPALVSALRSWLERALQMTASGEAFESAIHAQDELGDLRMHGGPHAIAFAASRSSVEQLAFESPPSLPPAQDIAHVEQPTLSHDRADSSQPSIPETRAMAITTEFAADLIDAASMEEARPAGAAAGGRGGSARVGWVAAALFATIAAGEAAWIVRGERALAAAGAVAPAPPAAILLDSIDAGDAVIVDGREVGVTPMRLALTSSVRSIRVRPRATFDLAEQASARIEPERATTTAATAAIAAARDKRGGLRIVTPIEIQVLDGERVLGSSVDGPVVTTAGRHELDFVNNAFGYRSRQVVDVKAGQILTMKIAPPDGRVSVNAVPWAQVSINGNPVGETPLANLPIPVGEHEITFRHPQLGEQTQKVIVKSNALTRVSATFSR